jgi:hypothetical protein
MPENWLQIEVFVDIRQALSRDYKVVQNPTYFVIDDRGRIKYTGFGQRSPEEIMVLMKRYCSRRD